MFLALKRVILERLAHQESQAMVLKWIFPFLKRFFVVDRLAQEFVILTMV